MMRLLERTMARTRRVAAASGLAPGLRTHDRYILEDIVFPYFLKHEQYHRILFVGTDWYTRRYSRWFKRKVYATIDVNPAAAHHGSPQRHVVDSMSNLAAHFAEGELDLIICNGVFGWGLNEKSAVEAAFEASHHCLRDGGMLVLGWNDLPGRLPLPIKDIDSLRRFEKQIFPPLNCARFPTQSLGHTFDFYIKRNQRADQFNPIP